MMEFLSIQAQAVAANWITTLLTGTVRAIQDDAETQAIWNCLNLAQSEVPQDQEESLTYAFKTLGAKGMRCFINDVLSERPQTEISKVLERGGLDPKTLPGANAALQLFADSFVKALKNHAKNQNSPLFNRVSIANQERMLINQASQDQIILLRIDTAVQQILSQQSQEHFLSPDTVIQNWLNSSKPPEKLRKLMEQARSAQNSDEQRSLLKQALEHNETERKKLEAKNSMMAGDSAQLYAMEADVWAKDQVFDQVEALYAKALEILPSEYGELRQQYLKARCIAGNRYLFGFALVNDFEQVKVLFQSMINRGFIPNVITYNSLIQRASDYPTARGLLDEMKRAGLTPNVISYTSLIPHASDYPTARGLLDEMKREGFTPDVFSYTSLIHRASDYQTARGLLDEMKQAGLTPDVFSYTSLIHRASDYPTARGLLDEMKREGLTPDVITYTSLISRASDYPTARDLLDEMKHAGLTPNVIRYNSLISRASDYPTARDLLDEVKHAGLTPNVITYTSLIALASDYPTARGLLDEMKQAGLTPNVICYNSLISRASNYQTARDLLDEMKQAELTPNVISYTSLISRASDYPTARGWLDEMKHAGLTPNVITYTSLIARASDYQTARNLLDEMKHEGVTPNEKHLSSVAKKITDANQADDLTDWAKSHHLGGFRYFSSLYSVLPYFMSATAILAWHFQTYKKIALRFDQALEATTKAYVQRRQPEEALRVMWAFPHFDSAKRLFRTHFDTCKQCLLENYNNGVEQHHISYALGICFYENGHLEDAKQWLNSAKNNANNQLNKKRMASIENILTAIARRKVGD